MLKRPSNEKTGPANTKLVKCSSLQEQEQERRKDQAESSLDQDSGVHSMDVDDDENEVTTQSTIVEERMTGDNGNRSRPFAENVLQYQIKDLRNKGSDAEMRIVEYCCALLNAGGGVLEMPIAKFKTQSLLSDLDTFWKRVEPNLKKLIEPQSYAEVFDRECDSISGKVLLFIKRKPNQFYTWKFHLFLVGDAETNEASYTKVKSVMTKKSPNRKDTLGDLPKLNEEFVSGQRVSFHEGKQIQLKHYESRKILDPHSNHKQCDRVRRAISSFANGSGGIVFLGITDDGVAKGQSLEGDSKEAIEERVNTLISDMQWPPSAEPAQGKHWDVKFFPLKGKENYFIIMIRVVRVPGGVFAKCPESFELRASEDSIEGKIHRLSFNEWHRRMVGGTDFQGSKGVKKVISRLAEIRLGGSTQLWTVKNCVEDLRETFFKVKDDCPMFPEAALSKLPSTAKALIRQIQGIVKTVGSGGLLLFSCSWLRNVGPGVRPNGPGARPSGLICDLLLVSQGMGGLHLLTICEPGSEKSIASYSQTTARDLKKFLESEGGCDEKFYISKHVVSCSVTTNLDGLGANSLYPAVYDMGHTPEKLNKILNALVIVLAKVPSTLSSALGVTFMNLLTPLQFQLVHEQIDEPGSRELWIKGPAGSGKTLVAIEVIRELQVRDEYLTKDNILYVCENKGLREQVRKADVCQCVCRKTFMTYESPNVKHVIMDEVQNFRAEDGDWLREARRLVRSGGREKDPGYLWLFIDNSQLNHSFESGIPNEICQVPHFRLKKVIRNSKRIFDYSMKFRPDWAKSKIELGHDFRGYKVTREEYSEGESKQICLQRVLKALFTEGFSERDITVLYGKEDDIPRYLSGKLGLITVTAEENSSNHLVVSTLRMYSGLERPVVVMVDLMKSLPYRSYPDRSMYCAVTRAMVKLVVIEQKAATDLATHTDEALPLK